MVEVDTIHLPPGEGIVVACSGGGDSVALLHLLARLAPERKWRLAVAHLDHGLRASSAREADFVRDLAADLALPCISERQEVGDRMQAGESTESAARRLRYGFLRRVRDRELPGGVIATGHTRDDQLETIALRLERGAGVRGLRAILPRRADGVVRPLLGVRRDELRTWLRERRLDWCEDESNRDTTLVRNRWRARLTALREEEYSRLLAAASDLSGKARTLHPLLAGLSVWWLTAAQTGSGPLFDGEILLERLPSSAHYAALDQALLDAALEHTGTDPRTVSARVRDSLLHLWHGRGVPGGGRLVQVAPRVWAEGASGGLLLVREGDPDWPAGSTWQGRLEPGAAPDGGGSLPLPRGGTLNWRKLDPAAREQMLEDATIAGVDGRQVAIVPLAGEEADLIVRYPRRGDRMRPFGGGGSASLADLFNSSGVPRLRRGRLPVIEAGGEILWLALVRCSEATRIADREPALQVRFDPA